MEESSAIPELVNVIEDDDVDALIYARSRNMILLSCDGFGRGGNSKGPTKIRMRLELYENGG